MAKGDFVLVKSEIGGKIQEDKIEAKTAGASVKVEWKNRENLVEVTVFGRTFKPLRSISLDRSVLRSLEVVRRDDE